MSQHTNGNGDCCDCPPELTVPENSDLENQQDVFGVTAVTARKDETGGTVSLDLNESEVWTAYNNSCARADGSFEEFYAQVQSEADAGASEIYSQGAAINDDWIERQRSSRILWVRICIKLKWIRIYINWHI